MFQRDRGRVNGRKVDYRSKKILHSSVAIIVPVAVSVLMVSILYAGASAALTESDRSPGPPLNLEAEAGDGFVILRWSPPEDSGDSPIIGYMVYRGLTPDTLYSLGLVGNVTTYNDNTVENGKTYYYSVSAINMQGEGNRSAVVSVIPLGIPEAPLSVDAIKGDGFIVITWSQPASDGGTPVLNYLIYRGFSPSHMSPYAIVGNTTFSYTDGNVSEGFVYYYTVAAVNSMGKGEPSEIVSVSFISEKQSYDVYMLAGVSAAAVTILLVFIVKRRKR